MKMYYKNSSLVAIWNKLPAPLCNVSKQGGSVPTCLTCTHTPPVGTSRMSKMSGAQKHPGWVLAQVQEGAQAAVGGVCQGQQAAGQEQFAASQKLCLLLPCVPSVGAGWKGWKWFLLGSFLRPA